MIRINLLGQPRPRKVRRGGAPLESSLQFVFFGVAVAIGVIALLVHYGMLKKQLAEQTDIARKLSIQKKQLQQVQAEVESLKKEQALLAQKYAVIEELERNKTGAQELLDALANTVNRVDALWMTSITQKGNSLSMEGTADSLSAVANFITQLKRSGNFDKVEIKESRQDERRLNVTTFLFTLTADLALPTRTAPAQGAAAKTGKS
jgi:type IV pilus assembly protein PilN